ncbi:MAG: RcnB family protein [Hydrogenophaga sp.]|jgi:Ni/Co efflux regulator RcnB|uniref:RcnB family protein n=1 Tax=Comamonadaceae TaxID=80864 RepID=UPI002730BE18|nr:MULTISPECIES: RcnB family protein [Comamonadaceae]MDP2440407.1 RcnB family protein [Rhodoferax sp.]MDZ4176199.1 RcnB family protein [Hydrogenophaga sp.]
MKSRTLVSALLAATLGLSSLSAFAQPNDRRGDKHNDVRVIVQPVQHVERRDDRRNDRFDRRDDHRDARNNRDFRNNHRYYNARSPEFRRGHYIPYEYRHRQYFVVDHRGHRLAPPPRGHQWVQVGTDYVLIAIATGLIANIILNH